MEAADEICTVASKSRCSGPRDREMLRPHAVGRQEEIEAVTTPRGGESSCVVQPVRTGGPLCRGGWWEDARSMRGCWLRVCSGLWGASLRDLHAGQVEEVIKAAWKRMGEGDGEDSYDGMNYIGE